MRWLLLTWSFLFAAPAILVGIKWMIPGQYAEIGSFLTLPFLGVSLLFYLVGAPESLVSTGGHIACLTIPGVVVLLGMPALILLIIALLMGRARRA